MKHIIWSAGHQLMFANIVDSENCFLFDTKGKKYTDLESGVWCTCLGHNNRQINRLITEQVNRISHTGFCYCHPEIDTIAGKILEITSLEDGKCEFLSSGSEAVEYGMRIARKLSDKPLALTFSDAYFGAYGDAAAKDSNQWYIYDRLNCSCHDKTTGCKGNCIDFEKIPFEKIGIFLFEPGSSLGLVRFADHGLMVKIADRIRKANGIVMANEITTGIGRTGKWFGYQHYQIQPEIVAMGKGLGNGYPVSAVAVSKRITDRLAEEKFLYSQSHQNDPLGAMVAGKVIEIIQSENLLKASADKGSYLLEKLHELKKKYPLITEVRGRGMMLAIEFSGHSSLIYTELLKKGFIVAKRSNAEVLRLDPSFTIEMQSLELFLKALEEVLQGIE